MEIPWLCFYLLDRQVRRTLGGTLVPGEGVTMKYLRYSVLTALLLLLPGGLSFAQGVPVEEVARPVHNAANWADVQGPLGSLWGAWLADEAAKGRPRNSFGQITNIQGGRLVSSFRPDQVPPEAVAFMVAKAREMMPDTLVGGSAAIAATMAAQEVARAAALTRTRVAAEQEKVRQERLAKRKEKAEAEAKIAAEEEAKKKQEEEKKAEEAKKEDPGTSSTDPSSTTTSTGDSVSTTDTDTGSSAGAPKSSDSDATSTSTTESGTTDPSSTSTDRPSIEKPEPPPPPGSAPPADPDPEKPAPPPAGGAETPPDMEPTTPSAPAGSTASTDGRKVNLYVPSSYKKGDPGWGLVVALAGIMGNSDYPKAKLKAGCDSRKLIYAGLKAKPYGDGRFAWDPDVQENVAYIQKVIQNAEAEYGLSKDRTILFGFSNGAGFVISQGHLMAGEFEGFIAVESMGFSPVSDRFLNVVGSREAPDRQEGNRWAAYVPNMGHFIPGPKVPPYPDPGLDTTASGLKVDANAMFGWVLGEGQ
jgi:hypothetical protein